MTTENYLISSQIVNVKMHLHVCGIDNNWSPCKDSIITSQLYL